MKHGRHWKSTSLFNRCRFRITGCPPGDHPHMGKIRVDAAATKTKRQEDVLRERPEKAAFYSEVGAGRVQPACHTLLFATLSLLAYQWMWQSGELLNRKRIHQTLLERSRYLLHSFQQGASLHFVQQRNRSTRPKWKTTTEFQYATINQSTAR